MNLKKILVETVGWYGTAAILLAYALVSFSVIQSTSPAYQLLNATGAIGIVIVSLSKKAYQPATLNAVWTLIAVIALIGLIR